jgi:hypothetical protein
VLNPEKKKQDSLEFCTEDSRLKVGKKSKDFLRIGWICLAIIRLEGK